MPAPILEEMPELTPPNLDGNDSAPLQAPVKPPYAPTCTPWLLAGLALMELNAYFPQLSPVSSLWSSLQAAIPVLHWAASWWFVSPGWEPNLVSLAPLSHIEGLQLKSFALSAPSVWTDELEMYTHLKLAKRARKEDTELPAQLLAPRMAKPAKAAGKEETQEGNLKNKINKFSKYLPFFRKHRR
ncbi:hypothetical protein DSO57_1003883 [Entomophthora muscae]|uniref:Uncharacterized protein n=1 Tax=Entomophthora muscae TaxID=34485 RepID=A0ACC2RN82_9FUNG|nr:hypothetical protein DSO57_1003883 [Entomophthora muscae]